jgi:uncharacterized membrane protein YedE/YeeE
MQMSSLLRQARWSPYLAGAGLGVLSWITFLFMGKALGTSTTFVKAAGIVEGLAAPEHVEANAYLAKHVVKEPVVDWQFALVVMLVAGAFLAARLAGTRRQESMPAIWAERFGPSRVKRWAGAFLGGAVLIFGARLADGCTSGHALSGGLQLALSSWTFLIAMFAAGIGTAMLLYGRPANMSAKKEA